MFQSRSCRSAVKRFLPKSDAVPQAGCVAGHDHCCGGVEKSNIAVRTWHAVEHALQRDCIGIGVAAPQRLVVAAGEARVFRGDFEGTDRISL